MAKMWMYVYFSFSLEDVIGLMRYIIPYIGTIKPAVHMDSCVNTKQNNYDQGTLQTVSRAIKVVDILARSDSAGVTEVADELELSKSTVHTYLKTLERSGYVVRNGNEYALAYKLWLLGESIRNRSYLYQVTRQEVDQLAAETGHYAHLTVAENGKGVNLYQAKGDDSASYDYQTRKMQHMEPLHLTATGKAILASLSRPTVESILDRHGLPQRTPHTITDREELFAELDAIADRGYAYNDEEEVEGFRAVGAPIVGPNEEVFGAVSASGPRSVLKGDRFDNKFPDMVTRTANLVQVNINMSSNYPSNIEPS